MPDQPAPQPDALAAARATGPGSVVEQSVPSWRWSPRAEASSWVFIGLWLATLGMLQWSVVRFRVSIVATLTMAAVLLGFSLARRRFPAPYAGRLPLVAALLGSAVVTAMVPLFSYLRGNWLTAALGAITASAVVAGLVAALGRPLDRAGRVLAGVAVIGQAVTTALVIVGDTAPRIDVWVVLQQASDAMGRGENIYTAVWSGSPGVQDLHPYLPWMTALLAPGRWLAGDVRWALLVWWVVLLVGLWRLAIGPGGRGRWTGGAVLAVLVVAPGTLTQIDQAWTEPLLAALLVGWAVLVRRGHAWWAVVPLALACASKQHLALVVPLLATWQAFGWRRVLATGAAAAGLVTPWVIASPSAFFGDTVISLVTFHPIRFANTWFLLALNEFGVTVPFWATGLVVLGAVALAALFIARRQPALAEVLRWIAFVLLVANLVNKQAFYNQFWLSAALVLASCTLGVDEADQPAPARSDVALTTAPAPPTDRPRPG